MEKQKTICIVAPSLQSGGIERALSILSSHFVKKGHKVIYIACRKGQHFYELDSKVIFKEPVFLHTTSFFHKLFSYWNTICFVRKQLKKYKPDTILSFGDIINPIALLANWGLNNPIYISDRISPKQRLSLFKRLFKRLTYPKATGIIAQTRQAAEYKTKVFGEHLNMVIIPNSLRDIESCSMEKKDWIIGIGRLSFEKGFDRLLRAFAKVEGHKEWKLVLVGDGPERERLKILAADLSITDRVVFLGLRKDVDQLLAESKIFVIPSRCEGFPNALCEAMASPLPCISFDSIAASDIIENRVSGVVLPDGDIDALAREIVVLMEDEVLRNKYAKNAYAIREYLDKDKVGDMFLKYILEGKL
ncbi:glycosyltransferase [Butyricimonas virosa]|uniref:glycosyltransferase n=1 Tax=Butyricimonas virosa TaxID=544645 RepID=UPI0039F4EF98